MSDVIHKIDFLPSTNHFDIIWKLKEKMYAEYVRIFWNFITVTM